MAGGLFSMKIRGPIQYSSESFCANVKSLCDSFPCLITFKHKTYSFISFFRRKFAVEMSDRFPVMVNSVALSNVAGSTDRLTELHLSKECSVVGNTRRLSRILPYFVIHMIRHCRRFTANIARPVIDPIYSPLLSSFSFNSLPVSTTYPAIISSSKRVRLVPIKLSERFSEAADRALSHRCGEVYHIQNIFQEVRYA